MAKSPSKPRAERTTAVDRPTGMTDAAPAQRLDPIVLTRQSADDDARLLGAEWLLTSGLGGFAMGTASGVPARRYHGLLIGALTPPVGRVSALNAVVDELVLSPGTPSEQRVALTGFRFAGLPGQVHPDGLARLVRFEKDLTCTWTFEIPVPGQREPARVRRVVQALRHENASQVQYQVDSPVPARLSVRPLVSLRDMHSLLKRWAAGRFDVSAERTGCRVSREGGPCELHLLSSAGVFTHDEQWWHDFFYQLDAHRGEDAREDLFSPGAFTLEMRPGSASLVLQAALTPMAIADGASHLKREHARLDSLTAFASRRATATSAPALARLVRAADAFVVRRCEQRTESGVACVSDRSSIIAGYPWFSDWGRDTCISIPGLLLATGRLDEARDALLAFAGARLAGIVPNLFTDRPGASNAEYNTVDASLWFILAACDYREAAGAAGREAWDGHLAPACLDIIEHYRHGTMHHIGVDPADQLVHAGSVSTQLTWMDAKRNGVVFTPRHGKAVEINALWHSSLRRLSDALTGEPGPSSADLRSLAEAVARSFRSAFFDSKRECLVDVLAPGNGTGPRWVPDASIRPNQVFAVSLPHSPLSTSEQLGVMRTVREKLLTPVGLRTLSPDDPKYRGRFEGDLMSRDGAYHNGTVWPWLLGPYVSALRNLAAALEREGPGRSVAAKEVRSWEREAVGYVTQLATVDGPGTCLGQIAEVYDGDEPRRPQGCTAQAWSVAEALRVLV